MLRLYKGGLINLRFLRIKPREQNKKTTANLGNAPVRQLFLYGGAANSADAGSLLRCPKKCSGFRHPPFFRPG